MPKDLAEHPIHLGKGAVAVFEPTFDGTMQWYESYGGRRAGDGAEGRLVGMHTFTKSWDTWEVHPNGHEVVVVTAGKLALIQEIDGEQRRLELGPGMAAINEPGVWHTADVIEPATALFITAGLGTDHRPR
jgi:uncharacterized cupin superfamily protein